MNYRPEESTLMAYLYGELTAEENEAFEQYLLLNPEVNSQLENLKALRKMMGSVMDKEVIAPPVIVSDYKHIPFWGSWYFKTILAIAASLLLVIFVGKITDARIKYSNGELTMGFGKRYEVNQKPTSPEASALTANAVQAMINSSLQEHNAALQANFEQSQKKLNASIRTNLAMNSDRVDQLVQKASSASKEQIQSFVTNMQSENMKLVKDYFQLTSTDQKKYIEDLLVDFAKYMQQQRISDMQIVQTRLNSLEKNTDTFKQETEQILSSIITIGGNSKSKGIKN